jgi:Bacterial aa3 type cytochrome c oxidase subunit IV
MSVDTSQGNQNMDYAAHQRSYNLFITLIKYAAGAVAVILIGMALFLV